MTIHKKYYPTRNGDRIPWLKNYRDKLPNYRVLLGYTAAEIEAIQADADYLIYLYGTWLRAIRTFAQSAGAHLRNILNGQGPAVALPEFSLPAVPPPPAIAAPGALRRIFAFNRNFKTRPAYTEAIGEDLGIVGAESEPDDDDAIPPVKHQVRSGEVILSFKKMGHMGIWIESQTGEETEWNFVAIDTSNPYNDTRPLKVAGQPERRRYRVCYWDDGPSNAWTDIIEVTVGG